MLSLETSVGWLGASCIGVDYVTNINMKYSSLVNHMRTFPIPRMVFMHPSSLFQDFIVDEVARPRKSRMKPEHE